MHPLSVTPLYAGLLAFAYLFLTFSIIRIRRRQRVSVGDDGDRKFLRKIRGHANFAEYVPLALLLMVVVELTGSNAAVLHLMGALLLVGRLVHGWCFLYTEKNSTARVVGMAMTTMTIGIGGGAALLVGVGI